MRRLSGVAVATLLLAASAARAADVAEVWRGPGGRFGGAAVDPTDGSLWLIEGANFTHLSAEGALLGRSKALLGPYSRLEPGADGSCWVFVAHSQELVHLASDATALSVTPVCGSEDTWLTQLTASPADGSVWVSTWCSESESAYLARVDASGEEVWRKEDLGYGGDEPVAVDPQTGSAWTLGEGGRLRYLRADGSVVWEVPGMRPYAPVVEDLRDRSVWTQDASDDLAHISAQGHVLHEVSWDSGGWIVRMWVSPVDGSILVYTMDTYAYWVEGRVWYGTCYRMVRFDASGAEVWKRDSWTSQVGTALGYNYPDSSAWIYYDDGDTGWTLMRVSADGTDLWQEAVGDDWRHIAHDPYDGSLWSADWRLGRIQHMGLDGTVLQDEDHLWKLKLAGQSLDRRDGSVWAMTPEDELVHFTADGTELERRPSPLDAGGDIKELHISPFDGTWWVGTTSPTYPYTLTLIHLAEDGTELWRREGVGLSLTVDPADGSAFAGTGYPHTLFHLAADGTELWSRPGIGLALNAADGSIWIEVGATYPRDTMAHISSAGEVIVEVPFPGSVTHICASTVDPTDGSFYGSGTWEDPETSCRGCVFRMTAEGALLWHTFDSRTDPNDRHAPGDIALDPLGAGVWVTALDDDLVLLAPDGTELWRGEMFSECQNPIVDPRDGSLWVSDGTTEDYSLWHGNGPSEQVVRLVILGRFSDVPEGHWACEEIDACLVAGIVFGYPDGSYQPTASVTRDQMAVYIARALEMPSGEAALADWVPADPQSFPDVPTDHWAYTHIEYCVENGVVEGYEDSLYHPEYEVTRDQMAVYVARALVAPTGEAALADYVPSDPRNFPDVPSDFWAYRHVEYCVEHGVVAGYLDGLYHPEIVITRDQMAVYVARAFGLLS